MHWVFSFLHSSFSYPPASSSFSPFLLSPPPMFSLFFSFLVLPVGGLEEKKKREKQLFLRGESLNTSDSALCQGLPRDLRHGWAAGIDCSSLPQCPPLLGPSPNLLGSRCVRIDSGGVYFIHWASPFITRQGTRLLVEWMGPQGILSDSVIVV